MRIKTFGNPRRPGFPGARRADGERISFGRPCAAPALRMPAQPQCMDAACHFQRGDRRRIRDACRTGRRAPSRGVGTHVRGVRTFRGAPRVARPACGRNGLQTLRRRLEPRPAQRGPERSRLALPTCFRSRGSVPAGPNATARRSSPCSARLPTRISTECPEAGSCRKNGCGSEFFHIFVAIQLNFGKDENETDCLRGAADDGVLRKSVGPKGRGDEDRSETRPGNRPRGTRHRGRDECERGAGQPPLVARICGRTADARRAFGRGVGRPPASTAPVRTV